MWTSPIARWSEASPADPATRKAACAERLHVDALWMLSGLRMSCERNRCEIALNRVADATFSQRFLQNTAASERIGTLPARRTRPIASDHDTGVDRGRRAERLLRGRVAAGGRWG